MRRGGVCSALPPPSDGHVINTSHDDANVNVIIVIIVIITNYLPTRLSSGGVCQLLYQPDSRPVVYT